MSKIKLQLKETSRKTKSQYPVLKRVPIILQVDVSCHRLGKKMLLFKKVKIPLLNPE